MPVRVRLRTSRGSDWRPPAWAAIIKEAAAREAPQGGILRSCACGNRTVTLTQATSKGLVGAPRSGRPHNVAREFFARELMDVLALRSARGRGRADSKATPSIPRSSARGSLEIRDSVIAAVINTAWMPTSARCCCVACSCPPGGAGVRESACEVPRGPTRAGTLARPRSAP